MFGARQEQKQEKQENTFTFDEGTHPEVASQVQYLYERRESRGGFGRARFFYGDPVTGRDYLEEFDVIGVVGRSTGTQKIPLLIRKFTSHGGPALSTSIIVRIIQVKTGREMYRHRNYHLPVLEVVPSVEPGYESALLADGKVHANCRTKKEALNLKAFLEGKRFSR